MTKYGLTAKAKAAAKAQDKISQADKQNWSHLWYMIETACSPDAHKVIGLYGEGHRQSRAYDGDFTELPSERFETVWRPPHASLADRTPASRSTESVKARTLNQAEYKEVFLDSQEELDFLSILQANREVEIIREQVLAPAYIDDKGCERNHYFDFWIRTTEGIRIAIAIKSIAMRESSGIDKVVDYYRTHNDGSFADRFLVRTREHFTRDQVYNAKLILQERRLRDSRDVERLRLMLEPIHGSTKLMPILEEFGDIAAGFGAAVILFDEGFLELASGTRFVHEAIISVTRFS